MSQLEKIRSVHAREILDSRDNPTVETELTLADGSVGISSVPSGASTGSHEAIELRDGDEVRYGGMGVLKAVENVNSAIARVISGKEFDQKSIDTRMKELDGTQNKSSLGANAILSVSMAFAHAAAKSRKEPLYEYFHRNSSSRMPVLMPVPMFNIMNGGRHAADSTDIQEFMVVPAGVETYSKALEAGTEIVDCLKAILESRHLATTIGDEGGFAPKLVSNEAALELLMEATEKAGYKAGKEVFLAIDAAASEFYTDGKYVLKGENKTLSADEMIAWYETLIKKYPFISIEDGLEEDDWDGWNKLTEKIGSKVKLVGDDLFATNPQRLSTGIEKRVANSILIKLNQIGTVSETLEVIDFAMKADYLPIISHRSGETTDTTIADLAVGTGAGFIKAGAPTRGERTAKYNQLLRIQEELGGRVRYAGKSVFRDLL